MSTLIEIFGKDLSTTLGRFTSANFNKNKYDQKGCDIITDPPFKPAQIMVRINEDVDLQYAEQCAKHLNQLSPSTISELFGYSWQYCQQYCEYFQEDLPEIKELAELSFYIEPFAMYVDKPKGDDVAYAVELHCSWDVEHGMSWIIKGNKVLYVGEGMVHYRLGAWDDLSSYKNDAGNFALK